MNKNNVSFLCTILFSTILLLSILSPLHSGYADNPFCNTSQNSINLISKSSGLDNPSKEEGKTEYEVADINEDGFLDIISVGDHGSPNINSDQHGIMVWLGDGGNYWHVHQNGNFGYGGCAIGDLDLDGFNDIAWGVHHNYASSDFGDALIEAALGDGTADNWVSWDDGLATNGEDWGMFATDLADFDGDGDLDIVSQSFGCCNGIRVYGNNGDGSWDQEWLYDGGNVRYTIEHCDFNGDGYEDFVCSHWDVTAFAGDGTFSFTNQDQGLSGLSINAVDCGDFNNDGCDDLVVGLSEGVNCYSFDTQTETWNSFSNGLPASSDYNLVQFGDLNNDDNLDIVCYAAPTGTVFLGNGNGNWNQDASWTMPSPGSYSAMRVDGDVDFDGREDIIIQAAQGSFPTNENELRVYSPWSQPSTLQANLVYPNGNEVFRIGSVKNIRWRSAIPSISDIGTVTIELSQNGASGPWTTIASNLPNNGCFQWIVDGDESYHCRMRITITTSQDSVMVVSSSDFIMMGEGELLYVDAYGPYANPVDDPIQFYGSASNGVSPYQWFWDFGDGNTSTVQNPIHAYSETGKYTVSLLVTDAQGAQGSDATSADIFIENYPPIANFSYTPDSPLTYEPVQFTDLSIDEDGIVETWFWQFGDGMVSGSKNPKHSYLSSGVFEISLKVSDDDGASDTFKKYITIDNSPPQAFIDEISPNPAPFGERVSFVGSGEDIDGSVINCSWRSSIDGVLSNEFSFTKNDVTIGEHIISFKVQDDERYWSPWINETVIIEENETNDETPPSIEWIFPNEGLYINNFKLISLPLIIAIGSVTIEAMATDDESGIDYIQLIINENIKCNESGSLIVFECDEHSFGKRVVIIRAVDMIGNTSEFETVIWKYF